MFENLIQSTSIPILEQVIQFSKDRHTLLAGNLANLDTPGYQARDLSVADFQTRLKEALETRGNSAAGRGLSPGELDAPGRNDLDQVAKSSSTILRHDGVDVTMESQVTEMVKNQMQHNLALSIMTSQFRLLQTAISERV